MRRLIFLTTILLLCSTTAFSQAGANKTATPQFSSLYTDLDKDCKNAVPESSVHEGTDIPGVCKGYGGYKITLSYSAAMTSIGIERLRAKDNDDPILLATQVNSPAKGSKVEWRLANGKPFAVIYRRADYGDPNGGYDPDAKKTGETLIVKGLKGYEKIDFEVDVKSTPNPNQKARDMADSNYGK